MKRIALTTLAFAVALLAFALQSSGQDRSLTNDAVLKYASQAYDKALYDKGSVVLGSLNGTAVIVDYICSDICPAYTVRIIRLAVDPGPTCIAAGGVEKSLRVPSGVAMSSKTFCFPRVLVDNWNAYVR